MNKKFDISDNKPVFSTAVQNPEDLEKINVLWNSALYDWSQKGRIFDKLASMTRSRAFIRTPKPYPLRKKEKVKKISYRMQLEYGRNTINWQRTEPLKLLMGESAHLAQLKVTALAFGSIETSSQQASWQFHHSDGAR